MKKIILLVFCLYLGGIIMSLALDKVEENIFKRKSINKSIKQANMKGVKS